MSSGDRSASTGGDATDDRVDEFILLGFAEGTGAGRQLLVMEALDLHLSRREGLISTGYFRSDDRRWVEHLVWASQGELEASVPLEEDPAVAELFACFETRSISHAAGERVGPDAPGPLHHADEPARAVSTPGPPPFLVAVAHADGTETRIPASDHAELRALLGRMSAVCEKAGVPTPPMVVWRMDHGEPRPMVRAELEEDHRADDDVKVRSPHLYRALPGA